MFAEVGPLIDGHVEIPLGSGCRFAADGMLSQHADFPRILESATQEWDIDLRRDVPLVLDKWAPLGTLYHLGNVAFVNRPKMKIEKVFVVNPANVADIFTEMTARMREESTRRMQADIVEKLKALPLQKLEDAAETIGRAMDADYKAQLAAACCREFVMTGGHGHGSACRYWLSTVAVPPRVSPSIGEHIDALSAQITANEQGGKPDSFTVPLPKLAGLTAWAPDFSVPAQTTAAAAGAFAQCYVCDAPMQTRSEPPAVCERCRSEET